MTHFWLTSEVDLLLLWYVALVEWIFSNEFFVLGLGRFKCDLGWT